MVEFFCFYINESVEYTQLYLANIYPKFKFFFIINIESFCWSFCRNHSLLALTNCVDLITYENNRDIFVKNNIISESLINVYLFFNSYTQLYFSIGCYAKVLVNSISSWWNSCLFLERESAEFFGLSYKFLADTRRLLLDYNMQTYPLLKKYISWGNLDVKLKNLNLQVDYSDATCI